MRISRYVVKGLLTGNFITGGIRFGWRGGAGGWWWLVAGGGYLEGTGRCAPRFRLSVSLAALVSALPSIQTLHQARVFIDREFEEICEESRIADKLQTIDVMCAEQGYYGGGAEVEGEGTKASQAGPKMARAATLKAKREALEHLRRIKEDVEKRNGALEGLLEERKGEARALEAAGVAGLGSRLDGVGRLVAGWEREQEG